MSLYGSLSQGATIGGGGVERHNSGRRYLSGDVVPLRQQRSMDGKIGMRLLLCQLSPLGLVPLFTVVWLTEGQEAGYNGEHELTQAIL